jgi:hypothetical protein
MSYRSFQSGDLVHASSPIWGTRQIATIICEQWGLPGSGVHYYWLQPVDKSLPRAYALFSEMSLIAAAIVPPPVFRTSICPSKLKFGDFAW